MTRHTGPSITTAIVAAIAANLIEFVMQKPFTEFEDVADLRHRVHTRDGIIKLLVGMSRDMEPGFRYLQPREIVRCFANSDMHHCRECRNIGAQRVRELLNGPFPEPDNEPVSLPDLPHVPEAEIESALSKTKGECLAGTRENSLHALEEWVDNP
jgi:hypothetical protein